MGFEPISYAHTAAADNVSVDWLSHVCENLNIMLRILHRWNTHVKGFEDKFT